MAYANLKELLSATCDAIRLKEGSKGLINHQDIPNRIEGLNNLETSSLSDIHIWEKSTTTEVDGGELIGYVVSSDKADYPENGNVGDGYKYVYIGTAEDGTCEEIPEVEQATPSITVSTSGLITASATQEAGQVAAGTKSATKQLTTQAAKTYTPGTSDQTIASGKYLTGVQTIEGDSNLVASNIKSGVSIFGVAGSYAGASTEGLDTSDATATANDMAEGVTAYVNGEKVTGTLAEGMPGFTVGSPLFTQTELGVSTINYVKITITANADGIVRKGDVINIAVSASKFGDAAASNVDSGKTFTSIQGVKITGTKQK